MRLGWVMLCALSLPGMAAEADELFAKVVQPVLKRDCIGCHGDGQALSKLDLRTREAMLKGGTRGPAVVAGDSAASPLYLALLGTGAFQMPPGGESKRLPAEVILAFGKWIDGGAPWPEVQTPAADPKWGTYREEDLWAFRPLREKFSQQAIDGFINAKLGDTKLTAAARAPKATLVRRATIDLTGLPPTPAEVEAFVNDRSPDGWAKLVDRLLASPRYGERWARHWLDVTRYADTNGYSNDFERPNAWRYRDYVIRSFNNNKPYDRFIREQIAGDELYPGDAEALIATGFLRTGPWEHTGMSVEAVTRQMFLDDVTHNTAAVFLGVTLGCARCHDHKFDPIPTRDYYRVQAVFATTEFARPKLAFLPTENTADLESGRARFKEIVARTEAKMAKMLKLAEERVLAKHKVSRVEDLPPGVVTEGRRNLKELTPAEFEEYKLYQKHLQLYKESLDRYEAKAFAVSSGPLDGATDGGPNLKYPKRNDYKAPAMHILTGGNVQSPAAPVDPGVLSLVEHYAGFAAPDVTQTVEGRRAALANWIADARNPLTARVMVNRIWQYHFGRGIAADTNNFGKTGAKPTHPELLDWLAREFISSGWDVKAMHRRILLSDTYQRASAPANLEVVAAKDPDNHLLSYFSSRRVEAEVLRDGILQAAGQLSLETGGPGVFPEINADVAKQPRHAMGSLQPLYYESAEKRLRNRRTIYTFQQRSLIDPMVEVFNGPGLDMSCERREASTVPTQAFSLFNSQFSHDMALASAAKFEKQGSTPRAQIASAFRGVYGRAAGDKELDLASKHYEKMLAHHQRVQPPPPAEPKPVMHMITSELTGEQHEFLQQPDVVEHEKNLHPSQVGPSTRALSDVVLALFNSNEFVYIY